MWPERKRWRKTKQVGIHIKIVTQLITNSVWEQNPDEYFQTEEEKKEWEARQAKKKEEEEEKEKAPKRPRVIETSLNS